MRLAAPVMKGLKLQVFQFKMCSSENDVSSNSRFTLNPMVLNFFFDFLVQPVFSPQKTRQNECYKLHSNKHFSFFQNLGLLVLKFSQPNGAIVKNLAR